MELLIKNVIVLFLGYNDLLTKSFLEQYKIQGINDNQPKCFITTFTKTYWHDTKIKFINKTLFPHVQLIRNNQPPSKKNIFILHLY